MIRPSFRLFESNMNCNTEINDLTMKVLGKGHEIRSLKVSNTSNDIIIAHINELDILMNQYKEVLINPVVDPISLCENKWFTNETVSDI